MFRQVDDRRFHGVDSTFEQDASAPPQSVDFFAFTDISPDARAGMRTTRNE